VDEVEERLAKICEARYRHELDAVSAATKPNGAASTGDGRAPPLRQACRFGRMRNRRNDGARRSPGALEAEVLAVLWSSDEPQSPAEVQAQLSGDLAYTTVLTILSRLHDKGVATREKHGRSFRYHAVDDEAGLAARRMTKVLDAEPDRGSVLARFVTQLSESDEEVLRTLLREESES
jgi:predicted transcriptional regulator